MKRYVLTRGSGFGKHFQVLDRNTGLRWHVHPEMVHLLDKREVEQYKAPRPYRDPIPLVRSVERGKELSMLYYTTRAAARRAARAPRKSR